MPDRKELKELYNKSVEYHLQYANALVLDIKDPTHFSFGLSKGRLVYTVEDAKKMYKVKEINLMPNSKSNLAANEKTYSGDYLMKVGINAFTTNQAFSRVIELTAE